MKHNIFAFTDAGCNYPQYISINVLENGVEIVTRSPANPDGTCGATSAVTLSFEEFQHLATTLFSFACTGKA